MFGWTTWGTCDMGPGIGLGLLLKHRTGLVVAIPESVGETEAFLIVSSMNDHIEDTTESP